MLEIVQVLGVNWGIANLIYDYLVGSAWWAWAIDAGFIIAGVVTGGLIAAVKEALRVGLRQAVRRMGKTAAVTL